MLQSQKENVFIFVYSIKLLNVYEETKRNIVLVYFINKTCHFDFAFKHQNLLSSINNN